MGRACVDEGCGLVIAAVRWNMAGPARQVRTFEQLYDEILRLPEGLTGEILEDGVLRVISRPGKRHRRAALACLDALSGVNANLRGTGWWIEIEAEIRLLQERLAVPDLAGWRVERVPDLPDENPLTVLPDWCCEILSPRTARDDKRLKLPLYARAGIPWSWLVDPTLQLVEVYQTINSLPALVTTAQEAERCVLPPFETEISLEGWWLPGPPLTE
jgi:Uma2 family endonuclease